MFELLSVMSSEVNIDWSVVSGASAKRKRLHLEEDADDQLFHCPVGSCSHGGFESQRGCRKHVTNKHKWFLYFDEKPHVNFNNTDSQQNSKSKENLVSGTATLPCYPTSTEIGEDFLKWLTGSGGGSKTLKLAQQTVKKAFKFLKFCCEEEEELTYEIIDFSLGSPALIYKFVDAMQDEWSIGHAGRLGYLDAIAELMDFRKINSPPESTLRNLCVTEVHLKKARKAVSKMMKLQWRSDLDIETLEAKNHWATIDELLEVITHHLPRYEAILLTSKSDPPAVTASELTFATSFLAVYLFMKVKGSRPMTYQYLTVEMVKSAKNNGGYIDQKTFKTASKYGFDSLVINETSMQVLDGYIQHLRPLLNPTCDYVLVTRSGKQYSNVSNLMSKLVFNAIAKYIHPTRYRQIVETESSTVLNREEQDIISEDQKHSSVVAQVHYKKLRSRDVAIRAHECMRKLQGEKGAEVEKTIKAKLCLDSEELNINEQTSENSLITPQNDPKENQNHKSERRKSTSTVKIPLTFTPGEDEMLRMALKKHGFGHWKEMLSDKQLFFQTGRKSDSLKKRAERKFPHLCPKKK